MQERLYIPLVDGGQDDQMKRPDKPREAEIGMVLLTGCRCRCGHEWLPREKSDKPRVCPKCKSPNWDRPKRANAVIPATPKGR